MVFGYLTLVSYPYFFSKITRFDSLGFLSAVEEKSDGIKKTGKDVERLRKGEIITGKFRASEDNLGIVLIRFVQHSLKVSDIVTFRIKEEGDKNWYYINNYGANQFQPNEYFTFGFPPVATSKSKTFIFEVESLAGTDKNGISLSAKKPQFAAVYKYSKENLTNFNTLSSFIYKKLLYVARNSDFFGNWQILAAFVLSFLLIFFLQIKKITASDIIRFFTYLKKNFRSIFKVIKIIIVGIKSNYLSLEERKIIKFLEKTTRTFNSTKFYLMFIYTNVKKSKKLKSFKIITEKKLFIPFFTLALILFTYANPFLRRDNVMLGEVENQWSYPNLLTRVNLYKGTSILWDSFSMGGYSSIGHPQSQLFYLPSVLSALIFSDQILGMRFIFLLHLLLIGLFMTLLLRQFTKNPFIILTAVALLLFNSSMSLFITNGNPAEIFTFTWLLLVFYFLLRWEKTRKFGLLIGGAVAFSMIIYSGGAVVGVHISFIAACLFFLLSGIKKFIDTHSFRQAFSVVIFLILFMILTVCISSPRLIPILEYQNYSMRSVIPFSEVELGSLNFHTTIQYFMNSIQLYSFPSSYIRPFLHLTYFVLGMIVMYFLFFKRKNLFDLFLLILTVIAIISSMVQNAPINLYKLFYYLLPGLKYNYRPARFMLLFYFAMPIIIGLTLNWIISRPHRKRIFVKFIGYGAMILIILTAMIATKYLNDPFTYRIFAPTSFIPKNFNPSPSFYRWHNNAIYSGYGPHPYMALTYNQFTLSPPYSEIAPVNIYPPLTRMTELVDEKFINAKYKTLSVYGVLYEVEQEGYSDFEITNDAGTLIDAHDNLQIYKLKSHAPFIHEIENPVLFKTSGTFDDVSIKSRALFLKYVPDPLKTYIISSPDAKETEATINNYRFSHTIIDNNSNAPCLQDISCVEILFKKNYEPDVRKQLNALYYPKQEFVKEFILLDGKSDKKMKKISYSNTSEKKSRVSDINQIPGKITFKIDNVAPTYFAISQNYYPGWKALVDGNETSILLGDGMIQVIYIDSPGAHQVTMVYDPFSFKIGLLIFFLGTPIILFGIKNLSRFSIKREDEVT